MASVETSTSPVARRKKSSPGKLSVTPTTPKSRRRPPLKTMRSLPVEFMAPESPGPRVDQRDVPAAAETSTDYGVLAADLADEDSPYRGNKTVSLEGEDDVEAGPLQGDTTVYISTSSPSPMPSPADGRWSDTTVYGPKKVSFPPASLFFFLLLVILILMLVILILMCVHSCHYP